MAVLEILIYPDQRLRERCVTVTEITDEIRETLNSMAETMYAAPGIGLAAAQVGVPHRLIVADVGDDEESGRVRKLFKLVNPEIISFEDTIEMEEGCLSIPDIRENVRRAGKVTVKALDELGAPITIEAEGLLAVCLQHEIDHINGILFIDHLSRLKRELLKPQLRELEKSSKVASGK
jgi:peptide deformylase